MAHWPLRRRALGSVVQRNATGGIAPTILTGGLVSSTPGAWAALATTPADAPTVGLVLYYSSNSNSGALCEFSVDIGIGPSGSEQVVLGGLLTGGRTTWITAITATEPSYLVVPLRLPPNTQVSARVRSGVASATMRVALDLLTDHGADGASGYAAAEGVGSSQVASSGVAVGALLNSYSPPTSIGTLSRAADAVLVSVQVISATQQSARFQLEVTVGGFVLPPMVVLSTNTERVTDPIPAAFFALDSPVPAGAAVSARLMASSTPSGIQVAVHGLRK